MEVELAIALREAGYGVWQACRRGRIAGSDVHTGNAMMAGSTLLNH